MEARTFPCTLLTDFAAQVLAGTGVADDAARLTGASLVEADRRGTHSHGLLRLPLYDAALRSGGINPRPSPTWTARAPAVALLDADGALGQFAMDAAVTRVTRLARDHGIGAVAVHNSTHYGAGAHWTHRLAEEGLAAVLTSTTGPAHPRPARAHPHLLPRRRRRPRPRRRRTPRRPRMRGPRRPRPIDRGIAGRARPRARSAPPHRPCGAAPPLTACTAGEGTVPRVAHVYEDQHPVETCGPAAVREALAGSGVTVETYPAGQLGTEAESLLFVVLEPSVITWLPSALGFH